MILFDFGLGKIEHLLLFSILSELRRLTENCNGVTEFSNGQQSLNQAINGSPGEIRTLVGGSKARYAWPLHHRASPIRVFELVFK